MEGPLLPHDEPADRRRTSGSCFSIDFTFKKLGLRLRQSNREVLSGVTGSIYAGRLTAVMGPSGSGKTTFLTTLAGRAHYGRQEGRIFLNGKPGSVAGLRKFTGFVPQEDTMIRCLTVEEILRHEAALRLPRHTTRAERRVVVDSVMKVLGLVDLRHSLIGDELVRGVSGGQRKRVNIGMELVAQPVVLFADEPTSGLDSTASQEVLEALAKIARDFNMTVVAVIHQPRFEIFKMFDDTLLLGKGGHTCYIGPSSEALAYFESIGFACPPHVNPPDYFLDAISGVVSRCQVPGNDDPEEEPLWSLWERSREEATPTLADADGSTHGHRLDPRRETFFHFIWGVVQREESARRAFFLCLLSGLLSPAVQACYLHRVRHGGAAKTDGYACTAAGIILWQLGSWFALIATVVSYYSHPSGPGDGEWHGVTRWQQATGSYVCYYPLAACYLSLTWLALIGGGLYFYRKVQQHFRNHRSPIGDLAFLCGLGIPIFGIFIVFETGKRHIKRVRHNEKSQDLAESSAETGSVTSMSNADTLEISLLGADLGDDNDDDDGDLVVASERRVRWSALMGFAAQTTFVAVMVVGGWGVFATLEYGSPARLGVSQVYFVLGACVLSVDVVMMIVLAHRHARLPVRDRDSPSSSRQIWCYARRGLLIHRRNLLALAFDLGVCFLSGAFLGLIYYETPFVGGLTEERYTYCREAFGLVDDVDDGWETICSLAQDDPIIGEASLSCMAISLAAVAGSLRVFGKEKAVFARDSATGGSTEFYFLGTMLAHLPISLAAPLFFLGPYYAIAPIRCPFYQNYLLVVLLHTCASGFGFLVSVVVPASEAQLVGVLVVLVNMMFSGANPRLSVLSEPSRLGGLLIYPSYVSFIRWAQECFYLLEIRQYDHQYYLKPELEIYSYTLGDGWIPYCINWVIGITIAVRVLAFLALVKREP